MLIDASAWIEFIRAGGRTDIKAMVAEQLAQRKASFTCPTRFELLCCCTHARERELIEDSLRMSLHIPVESDDWLVAAGHGAKLARRGLRVGPFDLVIAAVAERSALTLLAVDSDFETIRKNAMSSLRLAPLNP